MFLTVMFRGKLDVPVTISLSGNPSRNTGLDDVLEKVRVCVCSFSHAGSVFILGSAQVNLWHSNALGGNATVSRVRRVAVQLNASRWTKMHYEAAFQQKSEDSSARYSRIREADITALMKKFAEHLPINPHRDEDSSSGSDDGGGGGGGGVCGNVFRSHGAEPWEQQSRASEGWEEHVRRHCEGLMALFGPPADARAHDDEDRFSTPLERDTLVRDQRGLTARERSAAGKRFIDRRDVSSTYIVRSLKYGGTRYNTTYGCVVAAYYDFERYGYVDPNDRDPASTGDDAISIMDFAELDHNARWLDHI